MEYKFNDDGSIRPIKKSVGKLQKDRYNYLRRSKENCQALKQATIRLASACKVSENNIAW